MSSKQKRPHYDSKLVRAIVALGNHGSKYYKTRHSIGFRVADELIAQRMGTWHEAGKQESSEVRLQGDMYDTQFPLIYVIKPLTYMNNSGQVVPGLLKKGIKPEEIVVIHDELEKPFSHLSMHFGGGAKGHNGLRSVIDVIGKNFWRLRFGISRPEDRDEVGDYVLAPFSRQEEDEMPLLIEKSVRLLTGS